MSVPANPPERHPAGPLAHRPDPAGAANEHELNFRALAENSHDAIAILAGPEAAPVFVNQRCADLLGYTIEELRSRRLIDVVPQPECDRLLERYRRRLDNQPEPALYESRLRHRDGRILDVEIAGARTTWQGEPADVVIVRDITERLRTERQMRLLSTVTDQMAGSVIVTDRHGIIEYVNPAFERATGYSASEAIGRKPNLIKSSQHPPEFYAELWRTLIDGEVFRGVIVNRRKDGAHYYEDKIITPIRDSRGEIAHFVATGKDITDRVRSEEALRESEARFRSLTELSSDWYWEQDEHLRFTTVTRRADADTRFDPETHFGKQRWELSYIDVPPEVWEEHKRVLAERRPFHDLILKLRDRDDRIRYSCISGEPVFDAQGTFRGYRGVGRDITERVLADEQMSQLAYYDSLTGLPNRALLRDRLRHSMAEADRRHHLVAILFIDLDRFKLINDSLGHAAGDALLQGVADRMRRSVRSGDTIARLGGDEFTVVLTGIEHIDQVTLVAQKLLDQFAAPFVVEGHEYYANASIGITIYPWDDSSIDTLLKNADAAMYHAKESGRGTFQFYTAELNQRARRRLDLETGLRQAFERRELTVHYQPIVELATGYIVGAEALLRWERPGHGLVLPMEFIPLAEDIGLILPLGEWVLETACADARDWAVQGFADLPVAVNLSGRQLTRHLRPLLQSLLAKYGLAPRRLELELTESLLMHDLDTTAALISELHSVGVSCSLDDFGTGYSSLSYLKRFPIDSLKIDRAFIRDIPQDPDDTAIARAIIAMAHTMGIRVVAEGVETREQFEFLRRAGCDRAQGYYCSPPLDAAGFAALLRDWRPLADTGARATLTERNGA